jgi:transposase
MREIINAIFYVMRGGIAWRLLPSDFPPWSMVYRWFAAWRDTGIFEKITRTLWRS